MLAKYKKKRGADKQRANLKTLGSNKAIADDRDAKTMYLTVVLPPGPI
jgi:hypothetical protein